MPFSDMDIYFSVREIADAAAITKALLFHFFHNKKELYRIHEQSPLLGSPFIW